MSYRPSRGGYDNSRGGFRGSSYSSRGGFNDNYRGSSRGGSTYRGSRGSSRGNSGPWSGSSNYNSMNRNSESNWSPPPDNNFESRNRYSGDNGRYSSSHNDSRRFKEGRRSERDSDVDGYLNTDEDYEHYGPGSSNYADNRNSRSSYGPDTGSYRESRGSYRGRGSSRDYHSDYRKPHHSEDNHGSSPQRYSGPSFRGRGDGFRGGFREMDSRTSRGGGYRGSSSYGNSEGMLKRKRHESPTGGWRPSPFRKGYDSYRGRMPRSNMHHLSDYRTRKIAEFREKTRQLREQLSSPSEQEEEVVEEVVDEEVEEEQSEEGNRKEAAEEGELKSSEQPKKKRKVVKKVVKILKKVKKPKEDDTTSTTKHSSKTRDQTTKRTEEHVRTLLCPHCEFTSVRTRDYEMHLMKIRHRNAMTVIARNRKRELFMIRQDQRKEQKEIDDNNDGENSETKFCKLCQLTYKQSKGDHFASVLHKKIKQATQPSCIICHLVFASPMRLEHHLCSIDHLEKVLNQPQKQAKQPAAAAVSVPNDIDDAEGEVDIANFMVLDSVGSGEDEEKPNKIDSERKKKINSDKKLALGIEFCKHVYYCELCDLILPVHENVEQHCHSSLHVQRYAHHSDKKNKQQQNVTKVSFEQSCSPTTKCESADSSDVDPPNKDILHNLSPNKSRGEAINNDFDLWSTLDMVLEDVKENSNSDNEISSTAETKNKS
ncbi:uncharacterized protein LOC126844691 [Adelges cooleyi]|uniref:uncharacterized protein LOC126844691 n=1 Tax=Adelges cooleyi TaxID=133065 RepID=UPI00217F6B8A|nr:uncharacterized protein LOC126844691 [Adelges cooleyi]XP_050439027.1 uncharacterized protein LOC126844691 [Adelges cooleyi]